MNRKQPVAGEIAFTPSEIITGISSDIIEDPRSKTSEGSVEPQRGTYLTACPAERETK